MQSIQETIREIHPFLIAFRCSCISFFSVFFKARVVLLYRKAQSLLLFFFADLRQLTEKIRFLWVVWVFQGLIQLLFKSECRHFSVIAIANYYKTIGLFSIIWTIMHGLSYIKNGRAAINTIFLPYKLYTQIDVPTLIGLLHKYNILLISFTLTVLPDPQCSPLQLRSFLRSTASFPDLWELQYDAFQQKVQ